MERISGCSQVAAMRIGTSKFPLQVRDKLLLQVAPLELGLGARSFEKDSEYRGYATILKGAR